MDQDEWEKPQQSLIRSDCRLDTPFLAQCWVQQIPEVLASLSGIFTIEELIPEFYTFGQSLMIAAPFILKSLPQIRSVCDEMPSGDGDCGVGNATA